MKKFISLFLIVVMLFSLCGTAFAGAEEVADNCDCCLSEEGCSGEDEDCCDCEDCCEEEQQESVEEVSVTEAAAETDPVAEESVSEPVEVPDIAEPAVEEPVEEQPAEEVVEEEYPSEISEEELALQELVQEETADLYAEDGVEADNTDYFPESGYYAGSANGGYGKGAPVPDEENLYVEVEYSCYTTQEEAADMLEALNEVRRNYYDTQYGEGYYEENGIKDLQMSYTLMEYSIGRAKRQSFSFSHAGIGLGDIIMGNGDDIDITGEILTTGSSVQSAISSWVSSSGHYAQIIDRNFTYCGICALSYYENGNRYNYWVVCFCKDEEPVRSGTNHKYVFADHPEDIVSDPHEYDNSGHRYQDVTDYMEYFWLWEKIVLVGDVIRVPYYTQEATINRVYDDYWASGAEGRPEETLRPGEEADLCLEPGDKYMLSMFSAFDSGFRYLDDEVVNNRRYAYCDYAYYPDIDQLKVEISDESVCELEYFTHEGTCLKNSVYVVAKNPGTATIRFWFDGYSAAYFEYNVTVCGGHDFELTITSGDPCVRGTVDYTCTCTKCGFSYSGTGNSSDGHNYVKTQVWDSSCQYHYEDICSRCKDTLSTGEVFFEHDLTGDPVEVVAPTCQSPGLLGYKCSKCGEIVYETDPDNPEKVDCEFDPDSYTVTTEPTCCEYGKATVSCKWCGKTVTETLQPLCSKSGEHTEEGLENGYWVVTEEATYTEKGIREFYCGCCGKWVKAEYIPILEHECEYGEEVLTNAADCTKTGVLRVYVEEYNGIAINGYMRVSASMYNAYTKTCTKCAKEVNRLEYVGLVHDYVVKEVIPATCQSVEITVYECTRCGGTKTVEGNNYGDHNWVKDETVESQEPTCNSPGYYYGICADCGEAAYVVAEPTGNHTWTEVPAEDATCTVKGHNAYHVCAGCGTIQEADEEIGWVDCLEHEWEEVSCTATCTKSGKTTYECKNCGETKTEYCSKLGHDLVTTILKEATCGATGTQADVCSRCGYKTNYVTLPATEEHTWEVQSRTEPTCTAMGKTVYVCSGCGQTKTEYETKLGHNYEYEYVAPTETSAGYSRNVCTRCGNVKDYVEYPATDHTWDEGVVTQQATCDLPEITTYTCSGCGETEERETGDALGHDYELVVVEATCAKAGYTEKVCTRCKDTILHTDLPATGEHNWSNGTVTKSASAVTDGEAVYTCSECGATKTEVIPADAKYGFFVGDVNGDGCVNSVDIVSMIRLILGISTSVKGDADINADLKVNLSDVVALLKILITAG